MHDSNITKTEVRKLLTPAALIKKHPASLNIVKMISETHSVIHNIIKKTDNRLLVVVGPCSIHDTKAAIEYAKLLSTIRKRLHNELEIIMRVYFEKPRTITGWKGLINDPYMDESFQINDGLKIARKLLIDINRLEIPTACEFLDAFSHLYIGDLISWGAIGARTTESQPHRELASSLPCPIGFKNGTDGTTKVAVDAIHAAASPHCILSVSRHGRIIIANTKGNRNCHVILRGGKLPNYNREHVNKVKHELANAGLIDSIMIDLSHGNSNRQYKQQISVAEDITEQIAMGEKSIIGVMIESNLIEGAQKIGKNNQLTYGQSITDGCLGWKDTELVLETLAKAVKSRARSPRTG